MPEVGFCIYLPCVAYLLPERWARSRGHEVTELSFLLTATGELEDTLPDTLAPVCGPKLPVHRWASDFGYMPTPGLITGHAAFYSCK